MFRKAQQSVAHQSTLPSGFTLGNRDLKALQEVINAEKDYIKSNARSAQDFHKASEALKGWSSAEGEDLNDCLSKLALLFDSYATAQSRMNAHLSTIRQHFKSVRSREESLAEMRARKRSLGSKIESVERKLAKMGPENKELMKTTAQLKELRGEMETLRVELQVEEAAIGDYKRRTAKEAMGIKCGGLLELAEKMTIIAEVGKLIIEEIPLEPTQPGMPRADYLGAMRTDQLLQEATRGIADVGFTPAGPSTGMQRQDYGHQMRPSEIDDSTQDYYLPHGESNGADLNQSGWQHEREDEDEQNQNSHDYYDQGAAQQSQYRESEESRTTPIYAQYSSSAASPPAAIPVTSQDTATDEWRKSRSQQTPSREAFNKPASTGTPIADQFASRSPDEVQVGGTGLHIVGRKTSGDSFDGAPAAPSSQNAAGEAPLPVSSGSAAHEPPQGARSPPYVSTPVAHQSPSGYDGASAQSQDESYFHAVGSTRAAQQSVRRPMSPGNASFVNGGSSAHGHMPPSSPYEPQQEGKKMLTAAAFRRGMGRVPSGQHMGASTTSLGMAGAGAYAGIGTGAGVSGGDSEQGGGDTAPLAIRKRISVVPGQTADAYDESPAPPYQPQHQHPQQQQYHQSIYGGLDDGNEMYAPPMPPGQVPWGSRPNSRPTSAAGWRG